MQPSETDSTRLATAGFADGGRRLVLRNADDIQTLEKQGNRCSPKARRKGGNPADTLIIALRDRVRLLSYTTRQLVLVKLLTLW